MESRRIGDGIELYFPPDEQQAAEIIGAACERSAPVIRDLWGLEPPGRCRVYIVASGVPYIFLTAPWYMRARLIIFFPLWWFDAQKTWNSAGGWTLRQRNPVIVIKSPRLLEKSDRRVGRIIFVKDSNVDRRMQHITCHELTHAFTAALRLPPWLSEGIAMVTVDRFMGAPTVRGDTLERLNYSQHRRRAIRYISLARMRDEEIAYHYVRGYWVTRYLLDVHPEFLKGLLTKRRQHRTIEKMVAAAVGLKHRDFWSEIDLKVLEHFKDIYRASMRGDSESSTASVPPPLSECEGHAGASSPL